MANWTKEPQPFGPNRQPLLEGLSALDGATPVPVAVDPTTGSILVSGGGSGGGGTQYTDGGAAATHPIGTGIIYNNAGTYTFVSAANPLPVSATISTAGLATSANQTNGTQLTGLVAGTAAIGSITNTAFIANAGTNLNTSALALESGGNLAAIKADTDKIPSQGQALAAASMPVVLPAAQITTLTPPTTVAVTGSATGSAVPAGAFYIGINNGGNLASPLTTADSGDAVSTTSSALLFRTVAEGYVFNGTGWDRKRSATASSNTTGTGLLGVGNLVFDGTNYQRQTVNSTTTTSKFGADTNILSILGTAPTTAGKLDVKGADGDVFVRQATASNLNAQIVGNVASGSSASGNPVQIGGLAKTTNPTAVSDGQVVEALFDKLGKQIVVGSVRDLKVNQVTTITSSASETTVLTAVASTFLDVYGCIVTNTSATAVTVAFKDSTAGTTQLNIAVPAGDTRGFMLPEGGAIKQTTVNNNWTATTQSVSSVIITMLAVKNT